MHRGSHPLEKPRIPGHPPTTLQCNRVLVPSPGSSHRPRALALPHLPPPATGAGRISSPRLLTTLLSLTPLRFPRPVLNWTDCNPPAWGWG